MILHSSQDSSLNSLTDGVALEKLPDSMLENIGFLSLLPTEALAALFAPLYDPSRKGGRPPKNPVAIFRALLWMLLVRQRSINWLFAQLRENPTLAALCGFTDSSPAVDTYYNFLRRIRIGGPPHKEKRFRKRTLRQLKLERDNNPEGGKGIVQKNADIEDQAANLPPPDDFATRLQILLLEAGVSVSLAAGLLDAPLHLLLDGSLVPSAANSHGFSTGDKPEVKKSASEHRKKKGKNEKVDEIPASAREPRLYADPTANWGYSASKDEYVFGHRLHAVSAVIDGDLLPLRYDLAPGNVPDGPMAVTAVGRLLRTLRQRKISLKFKRLIADKGYDSLAFHRFLGRRNIEPLIPIREKEPKPSSLGDIRLSKDGKPLCPANLEMRWHGFNKMRNQHVFNCPVKRPGREDGKPIWRAYEHECPNKVLCEPESQMGPILPVKLSDDPRMFPSIPRDSEKFKELFKERSNVERLFSLFKGPDDGPYRRDYILFIVAMLHGVMLHLKAAAKRIFGKITRAKLAAHLAILRA